MAEVIRMPLLSDTMTEGVIAEWLKKEGDTVKSGDILAEVETDKATMELENYADGTLLHVAVKKGEAVPVNGLLAVVGKPGEDIGPLLDGDAPASETASTPSQPKPETTAEAAVPAAENPDVAVKTADVAPEAPGPAGGSAPAAPRADLSTIKATAVRMPLLSDTMTEGVIASWQKKVGDKVKSGDTLAEVETDKATMELENYEDGTLLYVGVEAGKAAKVNDIIAIVGQEGANFQALLDAENGGGTPAAPAIETVTPETESTASPNPTAAPQAAAAPQTAEKPVDGAAANSRIKASPLARTIAKDKGIDLTSVTGSGENGRIVKRDLDEAAAAPQPAAAQATTRPAETAPAAAPAPTPAAAQGDYEDIPVSQMRKTIARRLSESLYTAPHFFLTVEINMDKVMELRGQLNEASPVKLSFNDFVLKAAAVSLKQHPAVNAGWLGDKIRRYGYVNIGVAVAVEDGLLVPVVRNADQKSLSAIAAEVKDYAGRAKDKKLQPKDWEGSTFSISNLGMFGIEEFTAIINPPDACILAVGGIKQIVGVRPDGSFYPTNVMKVTLSCDHRAVDGATGAAFLQTFKQLLEAPMRILV